MCNENIADFIGSSRFYGDDFCISLYRFAGLNRRRQPPQYQEYNNYRIQNRENNIAKIVLWTMILGFRVLHA